MVSASALANTVFVIISGQTLKDDLRGAAQHLAALLRVFVQNIRSTVVHRRASDRT